MFNLFNGYPLPSTSHRGVPRICTHRVRAAEKGKIPNCCNFSNKIHSISLEPNSHSEPSSSSSDDPLSA